MAAYNAAFLGGGYDPMTGQPHPAGVYILSFGPLLDYNTGITRTLGGNPDVAAVAKGKPLYLKGKPTPPLPQETGWKDTFVMYPEQVTRVVIRRAPTDISAGTAPESSSFPFDPNGGHGYVWHCYIVDHEDNEMMRPDAVTPNLSETARSYKKGTDY